MPSEPVWDATGAHEALAGRVAYEAVKAERPLWLSDWTELSEEDRRSWAVAATAVIVAHERGEI